MIYQDVVYALSTYAVSLSEPTLRLTTCITCKLVMSSGVGRHKQGDSDNKVETITCALAVGISH
jgi:hypothetical protein